MHYNCLVVDDEIELAKATCEYFQMFDTSCEWVATTAECEAFLKENTIDVLLLDIKLQDESGFTLCKKIRETSNVPILFISARQSDDDVLIALNIGGDDYIKKPYSLSVLLAKVKVIMKRYSAFDETSQVTLQDSVAANTDSRKANVNDSLPTSINANAAGVLNTATTNCACEANNDKRSNDKQNNALIRLEDNLMTVVVNDRAVALKAKEYKLFSYLFHNANRIITKDELFASVWGDSYYSDGTLNVHIRKLREKLEENPNQPKMIKTVWGIGYILEL